MGGVAVHADQGLGVGVVQAEVMVAVVGIIAVAVAADQGFAR